MDIKDLKKRREKLQTDISFAVDALVEVFKAETGISPSSISVDMVDVRSIGQRYPEYVVGNTTVGLELEE